MFSLLLPIVYVSILGLVFTFFVKWNKASIKANHKRNAYFDVHVEKQIYLELSEQYSPDDPNGKRILAGALMKRAMTDVLRIWQIREEKASLGNLVKQGAVGEDFYEKFLLAEQELEDELNEVMEEAEMYKVGWKDGIFKEASQLASRKQQVTREAEHTQQQKRNSKENDVPSPITNSVNGELYSGESGSSVEASAEDLSLLTPEELLAKAEERSLKAMNELIKEEEGEARRKNDSKNNHKLGNSGCKKNGKSGRKSPK